jgi:AraC-like DNA-binding protein/quercetin dioxygenase-like cupin family protein
MTASAAPRSTDPLDYQNVPRPLAAMAKEFADGHRIARHAHARAQLIFAIRGVMTVSADRSRYVVPPQRALWMPAGMAHAIALSGPVSMRTLYVQEKGAQGLPDDCRVLAVSPLLRELIVRATSLPVLYDERGADGRLMQMILDEIANLPTVPLDLPMPQDKRLLKLCLALIEDPADPRTLEQFATGSNASARTLARLFRSEAGMSFGAWRQQLRLLEAVRRMAAGAPVTHVALDLGYASPSAFAAMFRKTLGVPPSRYFAQAS